MKISPHKIFILGLSLFYSVFLLLCIWTDIISSDIFWKVSLTIGVIFILIGIYYLLMHLNSEKELKDKGFLKD